MKSWVLLSLLALTFYGHKFVYAQWYAFTSLMGLLVACLLWQIRGKRWTMIWLVSMWGMSEGLQVFVCQAWNAKLQLQTKGIEGTCDLLTGFPFATVGLMCIAALGALWLDRNKK